VQPGIAGVDRVYVIQILLPRTGGGEEPARDAEFAETRAELVEAFDGVTAYLRSPAQGAWTAPDGRVERDEIVMVEVVTPNFDRRWWREYGERLASRFGQDAIHIRALPAEMP
jgi:hypothetical protein